MESIRPGLEDVKRGHSESMKARTSGDVWYCGYGSKEGVPKTPQVWQKEI